MGNGLAATVVALTMSHPAAEPAAASPSDSAAPDAPAASRVPAAPVRIDIWSDVACPWCYIGKRRLDQAIEQAGVPVEVRYHAFELSPNGPPLGASSELEILSLKLGSRGRAIEAMEQVRQAAAAEGLAYDFDALVPTVTRLAHRLSAHAGAADRQNALVEALFRAHFVDGKDVGDRETLLQLAEEAGLDVTAAAAALDDQATEALVEADQLSLIHI